MDQAPAAQLAAEEQPDASDNSPTRDLAVTAIHSDETETTDARSEPVASMNSRNRLSTINNFEDRSDDYPLWGFMEFHYTYGYSNSNIERTSTSQSVQNSVHTIIPRTNGQLGSANQRPSAEANSRAPRRSRGSCQIGDIAST